MRPGECLGSLCQVQGGHCSHVQGGHGAGGTGGYPGSL